MPITTIHPDLKKYLTRWEEMDDALDEQDTIRSKDRTYLEPTSGMVDKQGALLADGRYERYKNRARFPGITRKALTGIIGLLFEKEPSGESDDVITKTGESNTSLAREVARAVSSYGRSVLVVDAPLEETQGGAFITRYHPKSFINWKVSSTNSDALTLAIFHELWEADNNDEYSHKTVDRYRKYWIEEGRVWLAVYDKDENVVQEPKPLAIDYIPVFVVGSISVSPSLDPIPLLPVKDCALSMYQLSADLRQDLYTTGQKQAWMSGISEEQYKANIDAGYGAGGCWYLGENGKAGLIESNGSSYRDAANERDYELEQASKYAVDLTQQTERVESGTALQIRAATQHASIYTMADSVSIGITKAIATLANWNGTTAPESFVIRTEFSNDDAADQIINALNGAINSTNLPRSVLFNAVRRHGYTDLDDEELTKQIDAQAPLV